MRDRPVLTGLLSTLLLAVPLAACGPGGSEAAAEALEGAVGYGEQRDSAIGAHAVAGVVRLDPDEVSGADPDVDEDEQLVAAVVSECASRAGDGGVVSGRGWSAIVDDGSRVDSTGEPVPATEGAPALAADRRVPAGTCAWGRVLFVVPDDREVVGVHHEARGARTTTWRASDRSVEEVG